MERTRRGGNMAGNGAALPGALRCDAAAIRTGGGTAKAAVIAVADRSVAAVASDDRARRHCMACRLRAMPCMGNHRSAKRLKSSYRIATSNPLQSRTLLFASQKVVGSTPAGRSFTEKNRRLCNKSVANSGLPAFNSGAGDSCRPSAAGWLAPMGVEGRP